MKRTRITDRLAFPGPEDMRSFLTMWDAVMSGHHREMIAQGGLSRYFPELRHIGKESA